MKAHASITIALTLFFIPPCIRGDELADLKAQAEQMQRMLNGLKSRITDLEKQRGTPVSSVGQPTTSPMAPGRTVDGKSSLASPSPAVPVYPGYLSIPDTSLIMRLNFKPRVDVTVDSRNSGDKYRFVTAKLPLSGTLEHGGGEQSNLNANGSQIDLDVRAPGDPGNFRLRYQNDFFGSDTKDMQYRLREAYGEYYGFLGGFTYSAFVDVKNWPDTLDYEGTNAVEWSRRALLHYRFALNDNWGATFGIEKPDILVDTHSDSRLVTRTRIPDIAMNLRWEDPKRGHAQLSGIFRSIGASTDDLGDQRVFGWGVDVSAAVNVTKRDTLRVWGVYGEGIGALGNDSSFENTDAAYDADGRLHALRYFSGMAGYTHRWSDQWRTSLSYGYVNIANTAGQAGDAYHVTHYGSANLIYRVNKQFSIGVEGLYGRREVHDGRTGDDFRMQLSMIYRMFE
jgi:hypothetical protein